MKTNDKNAGLPSVVVELQFSCANYIIKSAPNGRTYIVLSNNKEIGRYTSLSEAIDYCERLASTY